MISDTRKLTQRWAVDTTSAHGTVRYMETFQRGVADAVTARINASFEDRGSSTRAAVVKAGHVLIGEMSDR